MELSNMVARFRKQVINGTYKTTMEFIADERNHKIIPELKAIIGFNQRNPWHDSTIDEHIALAVNHTSSKFAKLVLFFHDLGKPAKARWVEEKNRMQFIGHEIESAKVFERAVELGFAHELGLEKEEIIAVRQMISNHMKNTNEIGIKGVRRMLNSIGRENAGIMLAVFYGDSNGRKAMNEELRIHQNAKLTRIQELVAKVLSEK